MCEGDVSVMHGGWVRERGRAASSSSKMLASSESRSGTATVR